MTPEFTVSIEPHTEGRWEGKYDIYVTAANGKLLVSSNQGYENRQDAVNAARYLFDGKAPRTLHILGADLGLDSIERLR